jgi:hypothetical protein
MHVIRDANEIQCPLRRVFIVGGHGRNGISDVASPLVHEQAVTPDCGTFAGCLDVAVSVHIAERDDAAIARQGAGSAVIDRLDVSQCVRRSNDLRMQDIAWRIVRMKADVARETCSAGRFVARVECGNSRPERLRCDALVAFNERCRPDLAARDDRRPL